MILGEDVSPSVRSIARLVEKLWVRLLRQAVNMALDQNISFHVPPVNLTVK